ncbi:DNA cytosine methyltransferase [Hymenobacter metallilatus]|uniref:DNA (cytosine-5-)-methyltransferase n=1 Tax=Hymenobacter metallilatus TaxID=2493666 RepID=A0A428JCN1_9BACT|nr:DNA cytosine methyltransferase [Hymenobacter metallilatus]RSK29873.1 hypothetical protein EI290_16185 [Hymenobacter metallilatus]
MVKELAVATGLLLSSLGLNTTWRLGDAFCGGGGTSTGVVEIPGCEVVWAINHDDVAIASHKANHPNTKHFIEDILKIDLGVLDPIDILWASLECTHFSNAKGGQSRDADSRMLAWGLMRYVEHFRPKYIFIENVREFLSWGPLVERNGRMVPDTDKDKLGSEYKKWVKAIQAMGYNYRYKLLNSADYGAHTSRLRYFAVFALEGYPIRFPAATHHKTGAAGLPKWKAVREVLDFTDRGESMFTRKKPHSDNTLRRTLAGVRKQILPGRDTAFVTKWLGNNATTGINAGCSVNAPAITVTTQNRLGLVQAEFMQGEYGTMHNTSVEAPCPALVTNPKQRLVQAEFLFNPAWGGHSSSVENPAPTVVARQDKAPVGLVQADFLMQSNGGSPESKVTGTDRPSRTVLASPNQSLVQAEFLTHFYNGGGNNSSTNEPCPTVTTKPKAGLVQADFMLHNYGGDRFDRNRSLDEPAGTITTTGGQQYLVQGELMFQNNFHNLPASLDDPARTLTTNGGNQFLMTYYGQGGTTGMDQACPTLTTKDRVAKVEAEDGFLFSHQFSNEPSSLDGPSRTLVASRRHQYLTLLELGTCPSHLLPQPGDSLMMRLLKYVCRKYGIADIRMRMLKVSELLQIQGFPVDYVLMGNQTQQKKFIGNAVVPHVARALVGANIEANNERLQAAA